MNIFIDNNAEFSYDVYLGSSKKDPEKIYADIDETILKDIAGEDLEKIDKYKITCKIPSYNDTVQIAKSVVTVETDNFNINPADINLNRMTVLIKKWDLKGVLEKPTHDDIRTLNPLVASVIYYGMDTELKRLGLS